MSQKKQGHRSKVLKDISKKSLQPTSEVGLKDQYEVIRKDIIKLRDDLQKGWTIARDTFGKKTSLNQFRKGRQEV